MPYLEVVVNSPGGRQNTFVYSHDETSGATVGSLVLVPFGTAQAQAIVVGCPAEPPDLAIRPIIGMLDSEPVVSLDPIALARWMSSHYCSSLLEALLPMLPPGVARRPQTVLSIVSEAAQPKELGEAEFLVYDLIRQKRRIEIALVRQALATRGKARQLDRIVKRLVAFGLIHRAPTVRPAAVRTRQEWWVRLSIAPDQIDSVVTGLARSIRRRRADARRRPRAWLA